MPERVAVFLDYQNVHLTAHQRFMPYGSPVEGSLVHPRKIAERIVAKRASRRPSVLDAISVFRGRPNPAHQPTVAAANDAQAAEWERDELVSVIRRDLNYRGWPDHPPREKGVDVALAIALVERAMLREFDVAVVFSSDTDLLPAVEMAFRRTEPGVEIACWTGAKPLWFPHYLAEEPRRYLPYCHFLDGDDFEAVRDQTDYLGGG